MNSPLTEKTIEGVVMIS